MIDRDRVRDKIAFLRRNLEILRDLARTPPAAFTERSAAFHAAVRLLQTSVEAMLDVGSHIVAKEGLGSPKGYVAVYLGITSSPAYVGEPEGNGIAERFIRTLKAQCLYLHRFYDLEEARADSQVHRDLQHRLAPGAPGLPVTPEARSNYRGSEAA